MRAIDRCTMFLLLFSFFLSLHAFAHILCALINFFLFHHHRWEWERENKLFAKDQHDTATQSRMPQCNGQMAASDKKCNQQQQVDDWHTFCQRSAAVHWHRCHKPLDKRCFCTKNIHFIIAVFAASNVCLLNYCIYALQIVQRRYLITDPLFSLFDSLYFKIWIHIFDSLNYTCGALCVCCCRANFPAFSKTATAIIRARPVSMPHSRYLFQCSCVWEIRFFSSFVLFVCLLFSCRYNWFVGANASAQPNNYTNDNVK